MSIIERQTELGRSLFKINTSTLQELAEVQRGSIEKYFEANRTFSERLPEVREVSGFLALQREYGETLWSNVREAIDSQNSILQGAFSETRDLFKSAFSGEKKTEVKKAEAKAGSAKTGAGAKPKAQGAKATKTA